MVLNDAKEQIFTPTPGLQREWTKTWPNYRGKLVKHARHLGVALKRCNTKNQITPTRIQRTKGIANMISRLPGQGRHRCAKAKQVIYASDMYGTEVEALTSQQITELRRQMGKCIWGKRYGKR